MIVDDIRIAVESRRADRVAELLIALSHFLEHHPEAQAESADFQAGASFDGRWYHASP